MVAWSAIYELTGISAESPISADEEEANGGLGDLAVMRPSCPCHAPILIDFFTSPPNVGASIL
jgi:hypothetical protein